MLKSYKVDGDYGKFSSLLSDKFEYTKHSGNDFFNQYQITNNVCLFEWKNKNKIEFLGEKEISLDNAKNLVEKVLNFKLESY